MLDPSDAKLLAVALVAATALAAQGPARREKDEQQMVCPVGDP